MIVSHYTAARWGPVILANHQIKVSSAHMLNDPFEISPRVDPEFYKEAAPAFFSDPKEMRYGFELFGRDLGYTDFARFQQDSWHWIPKLVARVPGNVELAREKFAEQFSSHFRLFFASKVSDSILMWAHYGEKHRGVVIEFDTKYPPFSELELIEVKYRPEKPDFNFLSGQGSYDAALKKVIETKAPEWAYEQEVRFRFPITATPDDLIHFDPRAVHAVVFGCRTNPKARELILESLSGDHYSDVAVAEFTLSKERFSLERHGLKVR